MKFFHSKVRVAALLFAIFLLTFNVQAQNQCVNSGGSCLDTRTFDCGGRIDNSLRCPGPGPVLCCFANARPSQCSSNGGYCTFEHYGCSEGAFDYYQDCPRRGLVCCASFGGGGGAGGGFGSSRRG